MHQVFARIVDYAGLFPPASLGMVESVREYATHRESTERWMLGRFVVGAARLTELHRAMPQAGVAPTAANPWPLAVVFGSALADDLALLDQWRLLAPGPGVVVDAIELRAHTVEQIQHAVRELPPTATQYFELPQDGPFDTLVATLATLGASAKLRTGGITPDLFPIPATIVSFMQVCLAHGVPFKFTAGLHHPFRGRYPLTYRPDADHHLMYGFVPLLLATAELAAGGDPATARRIVVAEGHAIQRETNGFRWEGQLYDWTTLTRARAAYVGFGSCSFREPVDELGVTII